MKYELNLIFSMNIKLKHNFTDNRVALFYFLAYNLFHLKVEDLFRLAF